MDNAVVRGKLIALDVCNREDRLKANDKKLEKVQKR